MVASRPRLALVSRSEPLTPHLHAALTARYPVAADVDVELVGYRRALIGALTFRPTWRSWSESYMKSNLGFEARSRLAHRLLRPVADDIDVVVQTHALFATSSPRAMIYVDCTYRQAMRGWPAWTPQRGRRREKWLTAETAAYRRALHLFAFTEPTRDSLVRDYGVDPARISVVGAGVNFPHIPPRRTPDPACDPVILFVGKDFVRKGGAVLLRAFETVRHDFPAARLQIVGTTLPGPTPPGVEVLGLVRDRQEMAQLYSAATVFCLPSLFDPSPLVVFEAMAYGLPCVLSWEASHHVREIMSTGSTGAGSAAGAGGAAGLVAETGDATDLADCLAAVIRNREVATQMGDAGYRATTARHQWTQVVDRMAPALDAAVQPARPAPFPTLP